MTINPDEIASLVVAAVLGNLLLLQVWWGPPVPSRPRRWFRRALLVLVPLAVFYAGWQMYWNRSEDVILAVLLALPLQAGFAATVFFRDNRRRGTPPGWGRLLCGNFLILLVLITSLFAVGEVYFRFFYDTTDSFAYTKVAQRWIRRHYHFNKWKFRDDVEYSHQIAPDKRRISFVGDSFTAGHGIKEVEDRFANRLRRLHPQWEVHVLAANGLDTGAELAFLDGFTQRGYQVDEVVLVYCLNDVNDLLTNWWPKSETAGARKSLRPLICEDSYFLDLLYHRLVVARLPWVRDYFSFVREAYRGPVWEQQQQRLRSFRDVVARHGGRLSVVTFPFLHALGPNYPYQFVHDQLDAFWRREGVPHLDLLPVFQNRSPRDVTVNRFDAHPNELANELAARALNEFLLAQLKTNPPPATSAD